MDIKDLFKPKTRYFIVSYFFENSDDNGHGEFHFKMTNGKFPSKNDLMAETQSSCMVVTNIMELSKKDYEDYIS